MSAPQTPPPSSAKTAAPTAEDKEVDALLEASSSDTEVHGSTASPAFALQASSMDESADDRPASVALEEREGFEMAQAFVQAHALILPSEQFFVSFRRAFDAVNVKTLRVTDRGESGLLVLELYIRNLEQGSQDLPRDLAYQCLQVRLSERRDVIRQAEMRKMRKELQQAQRGVAQLV